MHHLSERHREIDPGMQSEIMADRCERAIQSAQPCPICKVDYSPRDMKSHLGRHMQQLAIFALPKKTEDTDDEDADEERTKDSILGSFNSNPDSTNNYGPLGTVPGAVDDNVHNHSDLTVEQISALGKTESDDIKREDIDRDNHSSISGPAAHLSSIPPASHNRHEPVDTMEEDTTAGLMRHKHTTTEKPLPSSGANAVEAERPKSYTPLSAPVLEEECLSIFQGFISTKSGLRELYRNKKALAAQARAAVAMIDQLCRDGSSMEIARDLVLVRLYDIAIFIGFLPPSGWQLNRSLTIYIT